MPFLTSFTGSSMAISQGGLEITEPSTPTIDLVEIIDAETLRIFFTPGFDGNAPLTSVTLYAGAIERTVAGTYVTGEQYALDITGLTPGTSYTVQMNISNIAGTSSNASGGNHVPFEYTITENNLIVNEDGSPNSVTFQIRARGVSSLSSYYRINGITEDDFFPLTLSNGGGDGSADSFFYMYGDINLRTATITLYPTDDATTEGPEIFYLSVRRSSTSEDAAASNLITLVDNSLTGDTPVGYRDWLYTTPGTYDWVCPAGITKVSAVCIGGGGGGANGWSNTGRAGGGGELRYKNTITVVPGTTYSVVVGAGGNVGNQAYDAKDGTAGESSSFGSFCVANGGGGGTHSASGAGGSGGTGDGGGNGGAGGGASGGGGGAGGYSGNGGNGGNRNSNGSSGASGSGAAGGGAGGDTVAGYLTGGAAAGGGGTGLFGRGTTGAGGTRPGGDADGGGAGSPTGDTAWTSATGGGGGTVGEAPDILYTTGISGGRGGNYGGGGAGGQQDNDFLVNNGTNFGRGGGRGAGGAVRIIYGSDRTFPTTNVTQHVETSDGVVLARDWEFTEPGTYEWIAPSGVSAVSVVAVGGGGDTVQADGGAGGGGGGLGWKNNINISAGTAYTVVVGGPGEDSYFINATTVAGLGGGHGTQTTGGAGGGWVGNGGGFGGNGGDSGEDFNGGGGGGAGGYSGNGGDGGAAVDSGGGARPGGAGGGVGLRGEGASGTGGIPGDPLANAGFDAGGGGGGGGAAGYSGAPGGGGKGGSGGSDGGTNDGLPRVGQAGGNYGGGASGNGNSLEAPQRGSSGAVRIIWGTGRSFPITTQDNIEMTSLILPTGAEFDTVNTKFTSTSLYFDGTQRSTDANTLEFDLTQAFGQQEVMTIETWLYLESGVENGGRPPWAIQNTSLGNQTALPNLTPNGSLGLDSRTWGWYQSTRDNTSGSSAGGLIQIPYDEWQLLTVELEYNGSTSRVRNYLNGVPCSNYGPIASNYEMPGYPKFFLGVWPSVVQSSGAFQGWIGPIRVSRGLLYDISTGSFAVPQTSWQYTSDTILIIQ